MTIQIILQILNSIINKFQILLKVLNFFQNFPRLWSLTQDPNVVLTEKRFHKLDLVRSGSSAFVKGISVNNAPNGVNFERGTKKEFAKALGLKETDDFHVTVLSNSFFY